MADFINCNPMQWVERSTNKKEETYNASDIGIPLLAEGGLIP